MPNHTAINIEKAAKAAKIRAIRFKFHRPYGRFKFQVWTT